MAVMLRFSVELGELGTSGPRWQPTLPPPSFLPLLAVSLDLSGSLALSSVLRSSMLPCCWLILLSAVVAEVDDEKDSTINYDEIRAEPIAEIRY